MRRSEALGIKWDIIDFEQKTISVNHVVTDAYIDSHIVRVIKDKTNTKFSTRTLPLVSPFESALLKLKEQQKKDMRLCGKSYSKDYLEYINRDSIGELMKPGLLSQHFKIIIKKHGLKDIRFHDLKHSCASLLYANEVDLKAIQEWPGHSNITTTPTPIHILTSVKKCNLLTPL
ncbi:site-specific integrase [Kineothrix alysoides]|nr:site-specific integrase [Kineothrix alysoides]